MAKKVAAVPLDDLAQLVTMAYWAFSELHEGTGTLIESDLRRIIVEAAEVAGVDLD